MLLSRMQPIRENIWAVSKKVFRSRLTNCDLNSWKLVISRPYTNLKCFQSLVKRTHKGFVPGNYQRTYSILNVSCMSNCIYCTPKIVFIEQFWFPKSIALKFLKEVQTQQENQSYQSLFQVRYLYIWFFSSAEYILLTPDEGFYVVLNSRWRFTKCVNYFFIFQLYYSSDQLSSFNENLDRDNIFST